jgi:hypothetical protein
VTVDPALTFWLDWAESRGAACERGPDASLVLLPNDLRHALRLPEEVSVTADPEVAREDGAVLIGTGHPTLDHAARDVLTAGDVGQVVLAGTTSRPPSAAELLERARAEFPVDHGRLDVNTEPDAGVAPVLRVGALVTHQVSLHDRFQERSELWVDATSGVPLDDRVRHRLERSHERPEPPNGPLPDGLAAAFDAATRRVEERAQARGEELAADYRVALADEIARTNAYYDDLLANLARRRAVAPPERQAAYAARIEATTAERARRLAEVRDTFRPRADVRPYRLHLYWVPALTLDVDVQRGPQRYPLSLQWLLPAAGFLRVACPACGSTAVLVATKSQLGCRDCLPTSAVVPAVPRPVGVAPAAAASVAPPAPLQAARPAPPPRPTPVRRPAPSRAKPNRQEKPVSRRVDEKHALAFWQAATEGGRRIRGLVVPDSPLAALRRLFGAAAPTLAIGIPPGEQPLGVGANSVDTAVTVGTIETNRGDYRYALRWCLVLGRPAVSEILPALWIHDETLPWLAHLPADTRARLMHPPTAPLINLDPIGQRLWGTGLAEYGLPLAARRLALWWRLADSTGPSALAADPDLLVAAVIYQVARDSRAGATYAHVAATYDVDDAELRKTVAVLRRLL